MINFNLTNKEQAIIMSVLPIEETLKYVNQARTNPKSFAQYVQKDIDSFVDQQRMPLAPNFYYSTN